MKRLIMILLTLLFMTNVTQGQSTEVNEPWQIVERCIPLEIASEDWTFSGTLLMSSLGRLHAYHQGWDTPRILVFYREEIPDTGLLSPDGRWFATIEGERNEVNIVVIWRTESITVHSTFDDTEFTLEWENRFTATQRLYGHMPYWLDNEHLLYSMGDDIDEEWFIINPFTQEITEWQGEFTPSEFNFSLSPDAEKALYNDWGDLFWTLHNGMEEIELPIFGNIVWHPESSQFSALSIQEDSYAFDDLVIYDLDGNLIATVYDFPADARIVLRMGQTWSPDGRYLLFASDFLYMADMNEQVVINTCIPTRAITVAWSPTSAQVAIIESVYTDREIQVFDLNNWERYIVAYHQGEIIDWREDDTE